MKFTISRPQQHEHEALREASKAEIVAFAGAPVGHWVRQRPGPRASAAA